MFCRKHTSCCLAQPSSMANFLALAACAIASCHVTTAWTTKIPLTLTTTTTTTTTTTPPFQQRQRRLLTVVRVAYSIPSSRLTAVTTSESLSAAAATTTTTTPPNHCILPTDDDNNNNNNDDDDDDDTSARSMFGTKAYWDDVYKGMGDFPADMYSWYYDLGHAILGKAVKKYLPKDHHILLPGIGNDPLLLDLLKAGYRHLTAQDYSAAAIERQYDLLEMEGFVEAATFMSSPSSSSSFDDDKKNINDKNTRLRLTAGNVRQLPVGWSGQFDAILEKGLLDAVYLSGDGHVEEAVQELTRVLKTDGIFMSVSGVVPPEVRKALFFDNSSWECLRDGSDDLEAGCFVWRKVS